MARASSADIDTLPSAICKNTFLTMTNGSASSG